MILKIGIYDFLVLGIILVISIGIGFYHAIKFKYGKKLKSYCCSSLSHEKNIDALKRINNDDAKVNEYLTASKSMSALPIALSLLATFFSSTALLGFPAEIYTFGIQFWISIFGTMIPCVLGALVFGPMFARLKVLSVFEYFQHRFDSTLVRLLAVTFYLTRLLIGMGIVIYGPSTTLSSLTDIDQNVAIFVIGLTATLYTSIGGIKAVIWSDVFQLGIMFAGLFTIIGKGVYDVGGFGNLWTISGQGGRLNFLDFNPNPLVRQSFWSLFFGTFVSWLLPYCIDQQMVQRFSSAKSIRTAQLALLLNIPAGFLLISLCCFTGLVLYATYYECDPQVKNSNQLVPYFVMDKLGHLPGVSGLFFGSILCASLSSVSSGLNSMSAIILQDFLRRFKYFKELNDSSSARLTKIIAFLFGCVCTAFAFLISQLGGNLVQISTSLNGALGAPLIGLFLLASLCPFSNVYGVVSGSMCGLAVSLWISLGAFIKSPKYPKLPVGMNETCFNDNALFLLKSNLTTFSQNGEAINLTGFDRIYSLSYLWYSTIGVLVCLVVGILVSFITIKYTNTPNGHTLAYNSCKKNSNSFLYE